MSKQTIHVGTITKIDLLRAPKGHQSHLSGCGAHKDRKKDKKERRNEDRRVIREW